MSMLKLYVMAQRLGLTLVQLVALDLLREKRRRVTPMPISTGVIADHIGHRLNTTRAMMTELARRGFVRGAEGVRLKQVFHYEGEFNKRYVYWGLTAQGCAVIKECREAMGMKD